MNRHNAQFASGRWLVGGLLLAAAILAVWVASGPWREQLLVGHWRQKIAEASDAQAPQIVRTAASIGDPALPLLVEMLGSYRTSVALAAHQTLTDEVERWRRLSPTEASPKLALLAASLADQVANYGPVGRGWAAELVGQVIQWPTDAAVIDQSQLLADCGRVLGATAELRGRADWDARQAAEQLDPLHSWRRGDSLPVEENAGLIEVLAENHLPGGGLPIKPADVRRVPESSVSQAPRVLPVERPPAAIFAEPPESRPLSTAPRDAPPGEARRIDEFVKPIAVANRPSPTASVGPTKDFSRLETRPLMQLLQSADRATARAAEAELNSRGMRDVHLQLARELTAPDVSVRRALVDRLPTISGVDAQPWLLWLLEDSASEVRLAALTVLATSRDPQLRQRLAQKAGGDADPRIRAFAERLLSLP